MQHMACRVKDRASKDRASQEAGPGEDHDVPEVTFLYRLTPGVCPESYGVNVACLAGIPRGILLRADKHASELHEREDCKALAQIAAAVEAGDAGGLQDAWRAVAARA